jgi:hypothetical protein
MTLDGIPGYAIRSYLKMLGLIRHSSHPTLSICVLRELANHRVMGRDLLTKQVVEFLGTQTLDALWKRVNFCDQIHPVPACPEAERKPYDDGSDPKPA